MAEFGENIKKARVEKGITQQTLANHLFVTRQAVSRWEGGSRYPDLMTAKKLSNFLDISLDDLLSNEDMKLYPEKNTILESPISKGTQTAIISVAFMCYLIISIWYFYDIARINTEINVTYIVTAIKPFLLTCILIYAGIMSIRNQLNPHIAAIISTIYFGTHSLSCVVNAIMPLSGRGIIMLVVQAIVYALILALFLRFFQKSNERNPTKLYLICTLCAVMRVFDYSHSMIAASDNIQFDYIFSISTVQTLAEMLLLGLLCYLVYNLNCKRKRAAI